MSETLWQQYEGFLLAQMMLVDRANGFEPVRMVAERNLEPPFEDDDLPF